MIDTSDHRDTRTLIVIVAARLLRESGPAAVTTRGVAQGAGVQAPAIYRIFGDKEGLLEAVAEHVMAEFVSTKAALVDEAEFDGLDPLIDLRAGWQSQMEFGLGNPSLFRLMNDPARVAHSPAARSGKMVLEARVHRLAVAGRLKVAETRAVELIQAAGVGVITTLLVTSPQTRDVALADIMFEGVLGQILGDKPFVPEGKPLTTAISFRAIVPTLAALSAPERLLLTEWLDRAIASYPGADA